MCVYKYTHTRTHTHMHTHTHTQTHTHSISISTAGIIGDPHFMVPLQSRQVLCYSIQGYPGLAFNLIYTKNFIINAHFVDSMGDKSEATWIGKLAVIPRNDNKSDAVVFDSVNQEVILVGRGSFKASVIKQIIFNENGRISVKFTKGMTKQIGNPTVHVVYIRPRARFNVSFHHNHLNVDWDFKYDNLPEIHGLMGKHKCITYKYTQSNLIITIIF